MPIQEYDNVQIYLYIKNLLTSENNMFLCVLDYFHVKCRFIILNINYRYNYIANLSGDLPSILNVNYKYILAPKGALCGGENTSSLKIVGKNKTQVILDINVILPFNKYILSENYCITNLCDIMIINFKESKIYCDTSMKNIFNLLYLN